MNIEWDAQGYKRDFTFVSGFGKDATALIDAPAGASCLDLGCGNGAVTAELAARGYDAFGADASPEMLAVARAAHPELRFIEADATTLSLKAPVDAVFSNSMLHWVDRSLHPQMLASIAGALAPGGQFVFECGGAGCGARIHGALARAFAAHGLAYELPFYFPTIGEYAPLLEAAGLRVTHAFHFDRPSALVGDDGMERWIRMFVKRPFEGMGEPLANAIIAEAVESLRGEMLLDGTWYADYVRLRMRAVKRAHAPAEAE